MKPNTTVRNNYANHAAHDVGCRSPGVVLVAPGPGAIGSNWAGPVVKYLKAIKTYCMFKSVFCDAGSRCAIAFYVYTEAVISGGRVAARE